MSNSSQRYWGFHGAFVLINWSLENEIVGEALVALKHDELKEMGITSVGHRLTILKGVYDVKMKQDVPIESDHYIPLCKMSSCGCPCYPADCFRAAETSAHDKTATQDDISRIIQSIKMRDERILQAEAELRKVTEEYRKLREELLPVFRWAKDRSQPLPYQPSAPSPDPHNHDGMVSPVTAQAPQDQKSKLGRTLSKRLFVSGGGAPKTNSPTYMPQSIPEHKYMADNSSLNPSAAALEASSHLVASMNGGSQPNASPNQPSIPSPTSPNHYQSTSVLASRSYAGRDGNTPSTGRTQYSNNNDENLPHTSYASTTSTVNGDRGLDRSGPTPTPSSSRPRGHSREQDDPPQSGGRDVTSSAPSVEIFKSFRVSMDDPCYKVLPEALKKYHINADWRQYALYIVFGDQERCLGLEEKPLILFKQLDKEGRKPMFMLRRHAAPIEGHSGPSGIGGGMGSAGFDPSMSLGSGRGHQSAIQLPGGVL